MPLPDGRSTPMRASCAPSASGSPRATARSTRLDFEDSEGIGVRVRVGGAWGFAAVRGTGKADAEEALERALAIAAAQPAVARRGARPRAAGARHVREPGGARPVRRSRSRTSSAVLAEADAGLRGERDDRAHDRALPGASASTSCSPRPRARSASRCSPSAAAASRPWPSTATRRQIRSYPTSHGGHIAQAGYECFLALDLAGRGAAGGRGGGRAAARARLPVAHARR